MLLSTEDLHLIQLWDHGLQLSFILHQVILSCLLHFIEFCLEFVKKLVQLSLVLQYILKIFHMSANELPIFNWFDLQEQIHKTILQHLVCFQVFEFLADSFQILAALHCSFHISFKLLHEFFDVGVISHPLNDLLP